MVELWWFLLGAVIPVVVAGQTLRAQGRRPDQERPNITRGHKEKGSSNGGSFVCERVCTSKRMMNKIGAPPEDACVTVCAPSQLDACVNACVKSIGNNQQHEVPNWNHACFPRCQSECLKLLNSLSENSE